MQFYSLSSFAIAHFCQVLILYLMLQKKDEKVSKCHYRGIISSFILMSICYVVSLTISIVFWSRWKNLDEDDNDIVPRTFLWWVIEFISIPFMIVYYWIIWRTYIKKNFKETIQRMPTRLIKDSNEFEGGIAVDKSSLLRESEKEMAYDVLKSRQQL